MASLTVEQFKKRLAGTDLVSNFFGELEALQFPEDVIREHYPEALERWQLLGATQSTPWMWVMLAELCLASFLAPTAVLKPIDSISVYAKSMLFSGSSLFIQGRRPRRTYFVFTGMRWMSLKRGLAPTARSGGSTGSDSMVKVKANLRRLPVILMPAS